MQKSNNKKIIIGAVILVALIALFGVAYYFNGPKTKTGSKHIIIEVTGSDGNTAEYAIDTDAEYLRSAMDELVATGSGFSYDGVDSEFGIMVEYVDGERASYTEDGAYWALYVNGEYGQYGCDTQPVADGDIYSWTYELAQ